MPCKIAADVTERLYSLVYFKIIDYKNRQKKNFLAGVSLHYLVNKQRSIHIKEGRFQICFRLIQMNKQKKIITNY